MKKISFRHRTLQIRGAGTD